MLIDRPTLTESIRCNDCPSNPRSETFYDMIKSNFAPKFRICSVSGMIILIDLFYYILSLILTGRPKKILAPSNEVLVYLGAKVNLLESN